MRAKTCPSENAADDIMHSALSSALLFEKVPSRQREKTPEHPVAGRNAQDDALISEEGAARHPPVTLCAVAGLVVQIVADATATSNRNPEWIAASNSREFEKAPATTADRRSFYAAAIRTVVWMRVPSANNIMTKS